MRTKNLLPILMSLSACYSETTPIYKIEMYASNEGYLPSAELIDGAVAGLVDQLVDRGLADQSLNTKIKKEGLYLVLMDKPEPCPFPGNNPDLLVSGCAVGTSIAVVKPQSPCEVPPALAHELTHIVLGLLYQDSDDEHLKDLWWSVSEEIEVKDCHQRT